MKRVFAYPKKRQKAVQVFQRLKALGERMMKKGGWKVNDDRDDQAGCIWQRALEYTDGYDNADLAEEFIERGAPDTGAVRRAVDTLIAANDSTVGRRPSATTKEGIEAALSTIQKELQRP